MEPQSNPDAVAWQTVEISPGCVVRVGGVVIANNYHSDRVRIRVGVPAEPPSVEANRGLAPFRQKYRRPATCPPEREAAAIRLAEAWHAKVTRITVLNQERFSAICSRLEDGYDEQAVAAAVAAYGADDWHRKNNAWLDLADFFKPKKLEHWLRQVGEAARADEAAAAAKARAEALRNPKVRELARSVVKPVLTPENAAFGRFKGLPLDRQRAMLDECVRELLAAGWAPSALRPSWFCLPVRHALLAKLKP